MPHRGVSCHLFDDDVPSFVKNLLQKAGEPARGVATVMLCPVCHHANDDHARFCEQCGQPCNLYCPACNAQSRPGARFCSHCGQSLALPPAATPASTAPMARLSSLDEKLAQLQGYL